MRHPSLRLDAVPALLLLGLAALPAAAATFLVDSTADAPDDAPGNQLCASAAGACTLRAAVQEANALAGLDEIHLPAGTFALTLAGAGENAGATGDLDLVDDLTLIGAGERLTVLDAAGLDRLFDSHPPAGGLTLWLEDLTVRGGVTSGADGDGGCFRNPENGVLLLGRVTVRDCHGPRQGGAIFNGGRFEGNEVSLLGNGVLDLNSGAGGAIANVGANGRVLLLRSELRGNGAQVGGAIYTSADFVTPNTSEVRIEQSSLIGNRALQGGGAILDNSLTRVFLEDSTVAQNEAGFGGGLANDGGGVYLIRNSTIVFNHANAIGGGIEEVHFAPDFIFLRNSIVAGNTADNLGPDCHFRMTSEGGTLIGDPAGCQLTGGKGDQLGADPRLGPLLRLGARIWAALPQPGSPAIDRGANALCSAADQLGNPRPVDGDGDGRAVCDLGAIELGAQLFASGFETGDLAEWWFALP